MSAYIKKRMEKLKVTDDDIVKWADANGYGSLLPGNIGMVRELYIDANDDEELEFVDLEMRGKRVLVKEIPMEEWVILRVFMFKIARTTTYPMCPEIGCYAKVANAECQNKKDPHGYVSEPTKGIRQYYRAGDGGPQGDSVYVIVPAKYVMNGYNFEGIWCDVKGIWNPTLEGFFANTILPINGDDVKQGEIMTPEPMSTTSTEEGEEVISLPKGLDYSAFTKKTPTAEGPPEDEALARFKSELMQFMQIIPFFGGYTLDQFSGFITSNDIITPLEKLIEATPGCSLDGNKVIYVKP